MIQMSSLYSFMNEYRFKIYLINQYMGCAVVKQLCAGLPSKRSVVQTLARTEIWIEISVSCAPLHRLWDNKSVDTRASPKPVTHLERGKGD